MAISINLRVPEGMYEEIEAAAKEENFTSVPDFIRQALREKLKLLKEEAEKELLKV